MTKFFLWSKIIDLFDIRGFIMYNIINIKSSGRNGYVMNQMQIIKKELENHIGKKVIVRANKGRKKIVTRKGILKATYPSLFVLEVFNGEEVVTASYTYSDVLTSTVQVTVLDEDVTYKDAKMIS